MPRPLLEIEVTTVSGRAFISDSSEFSESALEVFIKNLENFDKLNSLTLTINGENRIFNTRNIESVLPRVTR